MQQRTLTPTQRIAAQNPDFFPPYLRDGAIAFLCSASPEAAQSGLDAVLCIVLEKVREAIPSDDKLQSAYVWAFLHSVLSVFAAGSEHAEDLQNVIAMVFSRAEDFAENTEGYADTV